MAKIFPNPISPDTKSSAEKKVYELLLDHLSDDFTVIHGCKWVANTSKSGAHEGECDFIISHPKFGALCLEVKGGGIRVDSTSGREIWYSIDRNNYEHKLNRSPVKQVQDSQYALREKLRSDNRSKIHWVGNRQSVRWAVCFPDVVLPSGYKLSPDAPHELVIDGSKLQNVQKAIADIFGYWHGAKGLNRNHQPTVSGVNALVEILAPSWELKALNSVAFSNIKRQIKKLSEDQFIALNRLVGAKRAIVTGGAGTGKTLLAMEQARRLGVDEGLKTLYLCFNRNLVNRINQHIGNSSYLSVMTFNEVTRLFVNKAQIIWNPPSNTDELFSDYLPNILSQALQIVDERYEVIIVDEGHDFRSEWWLVVEELLATENGRLYVFYDSNQAIYTPAKELPIVIDTQLPLFTNCRNTKNIHDEFQIFTTDKTNCYAESGPEVEKIEVKNHKEMLAIVRKLILRVVGDEDINPQEITILTPQTEGKSSWIDGLTIGKVSLSWDLDLARKSNNIIGVSTIYSYKGLENTVIFLTEMSMANKKLLRELSYVAISRACVKIYIIGDT
ncbi:MAG: ATP-binding domain-containing protein [Phototrophicaceae bacterium]